MEKIENIPDVLLRIVGTKKNEIQKISGKKKEFQKQIDNMSKAKSFSKALKPFKGHRSLISEVKKASPSAGIISEEFDPVSIALEYENGNCDAISVLTDIDYFKGSPEYLYSISKRVSTPILRKDFIICEEQIYESRYLGADSFLLIAAILNTDELKHYIELGRFLGMEPLVEVHDEYELEKALNADSEIVGINNRNLRTFEVDVNTALRLIPQIPDEKIVVGESGIMSVETSEVLYDKGCNALLIGEFIMRAEDKAKLIKRIKGTI